MTINTPPGPRNIQINKAAYYLTFIYNMVLLNRLRKRVINGTHTLIINVLKAIIRG